MMKIKYYLVFLMLAILTIVLMGAAASLSLKASGIGLNPGVKTLESYDVEEDLCFDPNYSPGIGFVVNPYQGGNLDQNQALIIGASISYILKEVKAFTIFAVALAAAALIVYVTIAFIILNRIVSPNVKAEEPQKREELGMRNEELVMRNEEYDSVNNSVNNNVNSNKETGGCFEDSNSSAAFLTRNIDEMLAEIDAAMEKSKREWSILL
jgi:hypothetical protein